MPLGVTFSFLIAAPMRRWAEKNNLTPMARLVGYGIGAVEPGLFGLGPVPAVWQALTRAGWSAGDVDRVEINEAFAAIALACLTEIGFAEDIVNVHGGPIAHGAGHRLTAPEPAFDQAGYTCSAYGGAKLFVRFHGPCL